MTRIDRYLVYLYVRVLAICFASICGLLIVVHVFSNLEEFIRFAEQSQTSLLGVLSDYYGPLTLSWFEQLSGFLAVLALLFVVAWLNRTNEFTSLLAAGITKRRVVRPLLIASGVVILGAAAIREFAIPQFQDRLDRQPQDLTGDLPRPIRPTFDANASVLIQGANLLPATQEIRSPSLRVQGGPLASTLGPRILAQIAKFQPAQDGYPEGYMLQHVSTPKKIDSIDSVSSLDGTPILLTSKDNTWIEPGNCFLVSDLEFEMLRGGSAWKRFASTSELVNHLHGQTVRGSRDLQVKIHQRIMRPAIDWTVLLLGIPVLLTRPDRHMFWVAGACLMVVTGFTAVVLGLAALGGSSNLLSPAFATWLPLLLFLPWGWAKTSAAMET